MKNAGTDTLVQHAHRDLDLRVRHGGQVDQVLDRPVAQGPPDALGLLVDLRVGGAEREMRCRRRGATRARAPPRVRSALGSRASATASSTTAAVSILVLARCRELLEQPLGLVEAADDVRDVRALEAQVVGQRVPRLPAVRRISREEGRPAAKSAAADW